MAAKTEKQRNQVQAIRERLLIGLPVPEEATFETTANELSQVTEHLANPTTEEVSAVLIPQEQLWFNREPRLCGAGDGGLIECNGVLGYLKCWDILLLFDRAKALPSDGAIVEIGSFGGLSVISMAHGLVASKNESARIHCVDTWQGSPEHQNMRTAAENLEYYEFDNFALLPDIVLAGSSVDRLLRLGVIFRGATIEERLQLE